MTAEQMGPDGSGHWRDRAEEPGACGSRADEGETDPVTLVGLVFETSIGLRRLLGPGLERDYRLPPQSFEVLIRLARSPGRRLRMSDLAAQTALTPSGLTRAVDRLVDAGLVRRHACPEDRRGAFAALSTEGTAKMEMALGCHRRQLSELLEGILDDRERARTDVAPSAPAGSRQPRRSQGGAGLRRPGLAGRGRRAWQAGGWGAGGLAGRGPGAGRAGRRAGRGPGGPGEGRLRRPCSRGASACPRRAPPRRRGSPRSSVGWWGRRRRSIG